MPITPIWNWQQESWPDFRYQPEKLARLEADFLRHSGVFSGALKHISADDQALLTVDLIGEEAMTTSEIEGEILDRASLQSSIRRNFGLATDHRRVPPAEQGIAQMMVELYRHFDDVLSNELLCRWHAAAASASAASSTSCPPARSMIDRVIRMFFWSSTTRIFAI